MAVNADSRKTFPHSERVYTRSLYRVPDKKMLHVISRSVSGQQPGRNGNIHEQEKILITMDCFVCACLEDETSNLQISASPQGFAISECSEGCAFPMSLVDHLCSRKYIVTAKATIVKHPYTVPYELFFMLFIVVQRPEFHPKIRIKYSKFKVFGSSIATYKEDTLHFHGRHLLHITAIPMRGTAVTAE